MNKDPLMPDDKFDINLKLYMMLKLLVKSKISDVQASTLVGVCNKHQQKEYLEIVEAINIRVFELTKSKSVKTFFPQLLDLIQSKLDLDLLNFSLSLLTVKDILLYKANLHKSAVAQRLEELHPLSLAYDRLSVYRPYSTRVKGALLALIFFEQLEQGQQTMDLSEPSKGLFDDLTILARQLETQGIEANQIFMLIFNESMNQSIKSLSGVNYEARIYETLTKLVGIPAKNISKTHDIDDASTEYDFFFTLGGRTYGVSAKRTLRERYKQFIKTGQSTVDVMLEITLGLDLRPNIAQNILKEGVYLFVADEQYQAEPFLQSLDGVFSIIELTQETLLNLQTTTPSSHAL